MLGILIQDTMININVTKTIIVSGFKYKSCKIMTVSLLSNFMFQFNKQT